MSDQTTANARMFRVTVREGDLETLMFISAKDTHQAKSLGRDHVWESRHRDPMGYYLWAAGVLASAVQVAWGEVYQAYVVNIKTGEVV